MDHVELKIVAFEGAAAAQKIEDALLCVPGVISARVDLGTRKADIEHGETVTTQQLVDAVTRAGYEAEVLG
ncbi:cation transporter [Propylenella binzhouense]|nr:heavy metal-associated domain-containing protein [Propylenella binzhouense]